MEGSPSSLALGEALKPVLIALLAAIATPALAAPPPFAPVPDTSKVGPALPQGVLRPMSLSTDEGVAYFLIEESVRRRGDLVDYWDLMVMDPPKDITEGTVKLAVVHNEIDCKARTMRRLFIAGYGDSDPSFATQSAPDTEPQAVGEGTGAYFDLEVLCEGDDAVKDRVTGYAEAVSLTRSAMADERANGDNAN